MQCLQVAYINIVNFRFTKIRKQCMMMKLKIMEIIELLLKHNLTAYIIIRSLIGMTSERGVEIKEFTQRN